MYNVKLDENKYFGGSYAAIGSVDGGIDIPTLPPTVDLQKALCYKYDYHDVTTIVHQEKTQEISTIDPVTGDTNTTLEVVKDSDGNTVYEDVQVTNSVLEWIFDETKYTNMLQDQLVKIIEFKKSEIGAECKAIIYKGIDVVLSDGNSHHFSLNSDDQTNITNLYYQAKSGTITSVPYHSDGNLCQLFSIEDFIKIGNAAVKYVMYHTTLCNFINMYLKSLTSVDTIDAVKYSVDTLTGEYLTKFNDFITTTSSM